MVNKISKGKRAEKEYERYLQSKGLLTWKPTWSRYGAKDVFNIADIIALKTKALNGLFDIEFIQVKTNRSDFYKARTRIKNFLKTIKAGKNIAFVVALRMMKGKWRVWKTSGDGTIEIEDIVEVVV